MFVETYLPDQYRPAIEATWRRWSRHEVLERLRAGDPKVWSRVDVPELADRLGWLDLYRTMRPRLDEIQKLADAAAGVEHVVLLGMGGSSLAPEVFQSVYGKTEGRPRLIVLDSTHPERVTDVARSVDPGKAWFVVSSKSGTTLETLCLYRYFWKLAGEDGSRFVAITDSGSYLEKLAHERRFRAVVTAPSNVGGRYSALTPFGLVPAAMIGMDAEAMLDSAEGLADRSEIHPSELTVDMGAIWAVLAAAGRDKLTILTSARLDSFPIWLEQLVAESLGKAGTGIVPVAGEERLTQYGSDRQFLSYRLESDDPVVDPSEFVSAGHPLIRIEMGGRTPIAREMLRAELATAAAAEVLGVLPFDQPDVDAAKSLAKEAMESRVGPDTSGILEPESGSVALGEMLGELGPREYVGIHAYLPPGVYDSELGDLRRRIGERTKLATTLGYGPRYLHSTGQLHKGGHGGVFLQLVDEPGEVVEIPETDYTFNRVIASQAAGDAGALRAAGKPVLRISLGSDVRAGLATLQRGFGS